MRGRVIAITAAAAVAGCGGPSAEPAESGAAAEAPRVAMKAASAAAGTPVALVQRLYARDSIPMTEPEILGFFARDIGIALMTDLSSPETQAIGADYRYAAQDFEVTELRLEPIADGPEGSLVRASFRNFGQPGQADILLCRRATGEFRIKDVTSADGSLRAMLKLPPAEAVETC